MRRKIVMGDILFLAEFGEFMMADQTTQIEGRVTKVEIIGILEQKGEETTYQFLDGERKGLKEKRFFFESFEKARDYIKKEMINKIAIRDITEERRIYKEREDKEGSEDNNEES